MLIHCSCLWGEIYGLQPATRFGRFQLLSLPPFENVVPDWLKLSIKGTGKPEEPCLDQRHLAKPAKQWRWSASFQSPADLLAIAAEGQIVDHAADEAVTEIDLRRRPIDLLPIGQRKIRGAHFRPQTIG